MRSSIQFRISLSTKPDRDAPDLLSVSGTGFGNESSVLILWYMVDLFREVSFSTSLMLMMRRSLFIFHALWVLCDLVSPVVI